MTDVRKDCPCPKCKTLLPQFDDNGYTTCTECGWSNRPGPDPYAELKEQLGLACEQASKGKGIERHGETGERFTDQIICQLSRLQIDYARGQAVKKIIESFHMEKRGDLPAAQKELYGAINYVASRCIILQENMPAGKHSKQGLFSEVDGSPIDGGYGK